MNTHMYLYNQEDQRRFTIKMICKTLLSLFVQTAEDYSRLYIENSGGEYSKFHGYAYDGVWVIARAIDQIIQTNGGSYSLNDFRGERLHAALNETNFQGVTVILLILYAINFTLSW